MKNTHAQIVGKTKDLTGLVFGRWTVQKPVRRDKYKVFYVCLCSCGNSKEVEKGQLTGGHSNSCGCLRTDMVVARSTTHGKYHEPERGVHSSMMTRCYNTSYAQYSLYGGRGIKVDRSWHSFESFYKDMGPRPSPQHQLDRIDNNQGYSKANCRWATKSENARNKRTTINVIFNEVSTPLIEVAGVIGVDYHALYYRYMLGERGDRLFRPSGNSSA